MSTTFAAMKGKLGNTDYFIIAMKAKTLVEKSSIPSEMDGWTNQTLEEKEQRDINYKRVKNQIAPYLANEKDRFFGAIIMAVQNFELSKFEPLEDVATKHLPNLYETEARMIGFLTLKGGEILIPLDGQHRLKAIQFALDGKDERGQPIPHIRPCSALANEDITVIMVPYDHEKARKIFTKVNRYAKPTTTGQNLVTDDDDFVAVSARMVTNNLITADLVKYKSNALGDNEAFFTTLSTIAQCNEAVLEANFPPIPRHRPIEDAEERNLYEEKINEVWEHLIDNITPLSWMLEDKTEGGDEKRREIRQDYLLGKPAVQVCLFKAFARLTTSNDFTFQEASDRLGKIDWLKSNKDLWDRLLISGNKILSKNVKVAAGIIYYVAGGKLDNEEKAELLAKYQACFPADDQPQELPPKVV